MEHSSAVSRLVRPLAAEFLRGVFTPVNIGREDTLRSIERLSAGTHLVSSAEYLSRPGLTAEGGLGDWSVNRERFRFLPAWQFKTIDAFAHAKPNRLLHAGRIVASVALLAPTGSRVRLAANGYLAVTSALLYPRSHFGTDGSDQVSFQSSAVAFAARAVPLAPVQDAAIWYLALQSSLSYAVSGWVKLFGPSWRSGSAVSGVMRTITYGNKHLWSLVKGKPRLAALGAHSMLAFEALFPLVLLGRGRLTKPFIGAATAFHTFIAGSMGLGRFLTSFTSMLPAVAYVTNRQPKSNLVPRLAAGALAAAISAGLIASFARSFRINRRARNAEVTETSSGNRLVHRWSGERRPGAPILVLEHGMISTPEHFAWVREGLPTDVDVLTYWRAGYGPSANTSGSFGVEEAADDLNELLESLPNDGSDIYVGGHSLGGLIARRAAEMSQRAILGVIYIDSSHPGQLQISEGQRRGADQLTQAFNGVPTSIRLGWGWLLSKPEWLKSLPSHVQESVLDQYRDSRLWSAGLKEWRSVKRYFAQGRNRGLREIPMPALVISAQHTLRADPAQNDLHRQLAESHVAGAVQLTIRHATHDSLMTDRQHAADVGVAIGRFIRETKTWQR